MDDRRHVGAGVLGRLDLVRRERRGEHDARNGGARAGADLPRQRDARGRPALPALTAVGEHGREQRRAGDAHPQAGEGVGDHRHRRPAAGDGHHERRTERHRRPEQDLVPWQRVDTGGAHRAGRPAERAQEQRDADQPHSGEGVAGQIDALREPDLELQRQVRLGAQEGDASAEGGHVGRDRVGRVREDRGGRPPLVPARRGRRAPPRAAAAPRPAATCASPPAAPPRPPRAAPARPG